jgi:hypothetical protein
VLAPPFPHPYPPVLLDACPLAKVAAKPRDNKYPLAKLLKKVPDVTRDARFIGPSVVRKMAELYHSEGFYGHSCCLMGTSFLVYSFLVS